VFEFAKKTKVKLVSLQLARLAVAGSRWKKIES
jgi:hypothetical protein